MERIYTSNVNKHEVPELGRQMISQQLQWSKEEHAMTTTVSQNLYSYTTEKRSSRLQERE